MDNSAKVSVIIPVYNAGKFLDDCLASLCRQTYENIEIIVVNDGSQDDSLSIIHKYTDSWRGKIRLIDQENAGVSVARNKGIEESTSEYICFVDADDIVSVDYVEYLLSLMLNHEAEVAVSTGICYTSEDFLIKSQAGSVTFKEELLDAEEATCRMLCYHYPIGCYAKMFKRSFIGCDCRFIPGQAVGEGFNFNVYALSRAKRIVEGNKPIYLYRQDNAESCMTKFNPQKVRAALKAIDLLQSSTALHTKRIRQGIIFADWHTHGDMYNWMVLAGAEREYPELYETCFRRVRQLSFRVLFIGTTKKEKIRAIMRFLHPKFPIILARLRHKIRKEYR